MSQSQFTPPTEGEVARLRRLAPQNPLRIAVPTILRAAYLLEQRHPTPVPVSERLPEPNVKVLAHYFNCLGKGRTICAIWVPAKSRSDYAGDADDFTEYDEEDDKFYWPEGWYEQIENRVDLGWARVYEGEVVYWQPLPKWWARVYEGEVVYWQPLPKWPTLPLPAKEVEE